MPTIDRVVKPKTRRGKQILLQREPKVVENVKQTLFVNGRKVSDLLRECISDLRKLKKPNIISLGQKHDIVPFEDVTKLEFMCKKYDTSLFIFASSNKKRPNNLIIGRLYDGNLLDMIEFGVVNFTGMKDFNPSSSISLGTKPCMQFIGPLWDSGLLSKIKNLFIDLFRGEVVDEIRLQGMEHVISFTATAESIFIRNYRIVLKKSATKLPRVELEEMGPSIDLIVRRNKLASDDLMKTACRVPQEARSKPTKNVSTDKLGTTHGRVHLGKQKIGTIQTRKMKGLRKTMAEKKAERKRKNEASSSEQGNKKAKATTE